MAGAGARRYGGRWNSPGRAAGYLGDSLALASRELLFHLPAADALATYGKLPVFIPEQSVMRISAAELPRGWAIPDRYPVTGSIGDAWIDSAESAVPQVPSAVIRGETNFVVNPEHADFGAIEAGPICGFRFDPRLAPAPPP